MKKFKEYQPEKKDTHLHIRVTGEFKEKLDEAAGKENITTTDFVVMAVEEKIKK